MSPLKTISRLAAGIFGAWLAAVALADGVSSPSLPLQVDLKNGEIAGTAQVQRAFLTCGTNQFLVVVPSGTRVDSSKTDKMTITPANYSYYVIFRVLNTTTETSASCRQSLLKQYPGASITEESSARSINRTGPSFDLRWKPQGTSERFVRVAYIPCAAGTLEFTVITDGQNPRDGKVALSAIMQEFRSNEDGKIEIIQFSGVS